MAKKKAAKKPRPEKYEDKQVFVGNFKDMMLAATKHAKGKSKPKKG